MADDVVTTLRSLPAPAAPFLVVVVSTVTVVVSAVTAANKINRKSQSKLGRAALLPSRQRISTPHSSHWLQWDAPHLSPKLPIPFDDFHPNPIYSSLNRPHSLPQMASRSNQPFCRSTPSKPTGRLTDGINDKSVPTPAYALLIV